MDRGVQWKLGINNKPLAYILISVLVAKYYKDTDTDFSNVVSSMK